VRVVYGQVKRREGRLGLVLWVSLVIRNINFSLNRQYSCPSFGTVFDVSLFDMSLFRSVSLLILTQLSAMLTSISQSANYLSTV